MYNISFLKSYFLLPLQVSLDLYIMREAAQIFNETKRMNTDWVAVIDEWACRFLVRFRSHHSTTLLFGSHPSKCDTCKYSKQF